MTYRKKLIEVALPLEAINMESAREKSIRHGHPSTLHLWWARRPLAACRAVLWATLVDDPSSWPDKFPTEEAQNRERQRLFDILGRITIETDKKGNTKQVVRGLVSWDDINDPNSKVLEAAQREIARCLAWDRGEEPPTKPDAVRRYIAKYAPPVYDPFAGGGSIPLEAQRLGLEAHASDLNPVAVLINKALIEIPPKFRDQAPVNPEVRSEYGGVRSEIRQGDALPRIDRLAEGDGSSAGSLSSSSEVAQGGNLRDALSDNASDRISASQHSRGLDKGIGQGKSTVFGNSTRFFSRDGDLTNPLRESGVVSDRSDSNTQKPTGRGESNTDDDATKDKKRELRSEERVTQFSLLSSHSYSGAQGLAADVRYYGQWMRDEAFKRIGHLYPKVTIGNRGQGTGNSNDPVPSSLSPVTYTVIAWLWARTVKCPNPACGCQMPLVRSFQLSTKKGKEAWVEPIVGNREEETGKREEGIGNSNDPVPSSLFPAPSIRFVVKSGEGKAPEGTVDRKGARCIACGTPVPLEYVRQEGRAGCMGAQMMAIVAEGQNGRVYLAPTPEQEAIANSAQPTWKPDTDLPKEALGFRVQNYGMTKHADLFTPRQLVALTTFSDLVAEAREKATADAIAAGLPNDDVPLAEGGTGARAYGDAIATYLGMALSKLADASTSLVRWKPSMDQAIATFGRQALPMVWDYAESNIFNGAAGDYLTTLKNMLRVVQERITNNQGQVSQHDATAKHINDASYKLISTDPPYYDNIGYADLADFFYVWLRRSLQSIYPDLFSTLLVPKAQELVATPYRFDGSKQKAQAFFEAGLGKAFNRMHEISHADYPLTVYYAFKQAETDQKGKSDESVASTGWETMLEGLIKANFSIGGTWPMRSELGNRMVASSTNALASSIVLVCRPRPIDAPKITRRQFLTELKRELPKALKTLQQGNIAPVDLAQASIGPGMAIYSQYAAVLENDGSPMRVRTALQLINQILDEYLTEQEGEFDGDTRWALTWFEQHQFEPGQYGDAELLSKAKNTSVQGMVDAGILEAKGGKVRLLRREEIGNREEGRGSRKQGIGKSDDSVPSSLSSNSSPDWLLTQYLIHELDQKGEMGAAALLAKLGSRGEIARDLAYRLYSLCDRKGWAQEGIAYNSLVISWPEVTRLASEFAQSQPVQGDLGF
jgi:putative DNA methylase